MYLCHLNWTTCKALITLELLAVLVMLTFWPSSWYWRNMAFSVVMPCFLWGPEMHLFEGSIGWQLRMTQAWTKGNLSFLKELEESVSWFTGFFQVMMHTQNGRLETQLLDHCSWVLGLRERPLCELTSLCQSHEGTMRPMIESEQRKGGGCCAVQLSKWES